MKKNMKIVTALMAIGLVSPMAYATNGDQMMAVGSQSSALGGTGVANYMGADSAWANPAMLGKSKGSEVIGGINIFAPTVTNTGMPALAGTKQTSSAATNYIPDVSYSSRISDSLSYGIAMAGIAGMGVDYTGAPTTHIKAKTVMSILRVMPTIAYNNKDYGVGFSPILQYGSLMLSYDSTAAGGGKYNPDQSADTSTGFGFALGGYYNVTPDMTVGASYQSEVAAKYGTQISKAGALFGVTPAFKDDLNQPSEIKLGVAYTMSSFTLTADYKSIMWGSAAGYKDFNWKNQSVVAVGAKYAGNGYWLGLGYNQTDDPIAETAAGSANGDQIDFFNNLLFPAIVKSSYTLGGGYDISKAMAIEASVVITPEVTKTVAVPNFLGNNTTTHSQQSMSLSLRYKF